MRVSKFLKLDKNILLEYIYDDNNNLGYQYQILINNKNNAYNLSYIAGSASTTNNTLANQLFKIDTASSTYGLVDTNKYTYLQLKNYSEGFPARHDTLKIHLPVNYTFEEYIGFYLRLYTFDYNNSKIYELSNFFFDITDVNQGYLMDLSSPALLFQEKLWGKYIKIDVPSVAYLSSLRTSTGARENSINFNLTSGTGLSISAPVFIDFHFIRSRKTVNTSTTYTLSSKYSTSLPQAPDFQKIGLKIQHSRNGDFFEVFGTFNGNIAEFSDYIENAVDLGKKYYVEYNITLFEQNIRGKTLKIVVEDVFNEPIEYRPIIKFSTTTAIIDVEMNLIDAVDSSLIQRRASYGMLQDEVSKYSLNLTKINLARADKPKIYNIKSPEGAGIFGNLNGSAYSDGRLYGNAGGSLFSTGNSKNIFGIGYNLPGASGDGVGAGGNNGNIGVTNESGLAKIAQSNFNKVTIEPFAVNQLVFSDRYNIVAKSENVKVGKTWFYGFGRLKIVIQPFDQLIKFILAQDVSNDQVTVNVGNGPQQQFVRAPKYLDLSNMGEIKLIFKDTQNSVEFKLYTATSEIDITKGQLVFKVQQTKINDIRKIYQSGINVFYITTTLSDLTTVAYSGLFGMYDDKQNVRDLNDEQAQNETGLGDAEGILRDDPGASATGTAIVTRRIIRGTESGAGAPGTAGTQGTQGTNTSSSVNLTNSSVPTVISAGASTGITIGITTDSGISINGYVWTAAQIKVVFEGAPASDALKQSASSSGNYLTQLRVEQFAANNGIQGINLYTKNLLVGNLAEFVKSLETKFLTTQTEKDAYKTKTGILISAGIVRVQTTQQQPSVPPSGQSSNTWTEKSELYGAVTEIQGGSTLTVTGYSSRDFTVLPYQLSQLYDSGTTYTNLAFKNGGAQLWNRKDPDVSGSKDQLIDTLSNVLDAWLKAYGQ